MRDIAAILDRGIKGC